MAGFLGIIGARRGFLRGWAPGRNGGAGALMIAHALVASWLPAFVALGGAKSPFLFSCVMTIAEMAGLVLALALWRPALFFSRRVWALAWRRMRSWLFVIWAVGYLDVAALAWAAWFVDISVSATLYYLSPLMFVLCVQWIFRRDGRYRRMGAVEIALFGVAIVGAGLAIASQSGGFGFGGSSTVAAAVGATLAIVGAALAASTSVGFKWGVELASELARGVGRAADMEIFCVLFGMILSGAILAPLTFGAGLMRGEAFDGGVLWAGVGAGIVTGMIASVLWRTAMLVARDLGIAVVRYMMPVVSLGWLFALGLMGDVDLWLLGGGAALIICANAGMDWRMRG